MVLVLAMYLDLAYTHHMVDLKEFLSSYCQHFIEHPVTFLPHNDQTALAFFQIRQLVRHLYPVHQWVLHYGQGEEKTTMQSCQSNFITSKGTYLFHIGTYYMQCITNHISSLIIILDKLQKHYCFLW